MKSTFSAVWLKDILNREERGEFGEGLGEDLQWVAEHMPTVRGLRTGTITLYQHPCQIHAPELIPGWCKGIVEDVAPTDFKVSDLEFVPFLNDGERSVNGTTMRQRAVVLKANYGLSDAKRLLENQNDIPINRHGKHIVFTGTVLRDSGGDLYVAYVYWRGGRWCMYFGRLGGDWGARVRLPRRK